SRVRAALGLRTSRSGAMAVFGRSFHSSVSDRGVFRRPPASAVARRWHASVSSRCLPHRQRLIDRGENLSDRQLVETLAMAIEPALTAFQLARQARQRILHEPRIAAALDRAGCLPRD